MCYYLNRKDDISVILFKFNISSVILQVCNEREEIRTNESIQFKLGDHLLRKMVPTSTNQTGWRFPQIPKVSVKKNQVITTREEFPPIDEEYAKKWAAMARIELKGFLIHLNL